MDEYTNKNQEPETGLNSQGAGEGTQGNEGWNWQPQAQEEPEWQKRPEPEVTPEPQNQDSQSQVPQGQMPQGQVPQSQVPQNQVPQNPVPAGYGQQSGPNGQNWQNGQNQQPDTGWQSGQNSQNWQNGQNQQRPQQYPGWQGGQNGQNWQNRQNQQGPQQGPGWQNQQYQPYQQPQPKQSNGVALASMIVGIFALLTCCIPFIQFPLAVIAIVLVIISKKGKPFHGFAIAGLVLGIISILISIGMTIYWGAVITMMKDPEFMSMYNEILEMYQ